MNVKPTPARRNVVLDIETVSLDAENPNGALSALTGRIVCIGILIDDGENLAERCLISEDESEIIKGFWDVIRANDLLIGHNIWGFDLPFIRQRSWILGIRPSRKIDLRRFYTTDLFDTQQMFSIWGTTKYPSLADLAGALGCPAKSGQGEMVAAWWSSGDLDAIETYCLNDVHVSYLTFLKLLFQDTPDRFPPFRLQPSAKPYARIYEMKTRKKAVSDSSGPIF